MRHIPQSIKAALLGAILAVTTTGAQASEPHNHQTMTSIDATSQSAISAKGVVKDIDFDNKKVTIEHEAIPSISWPAMTMRFTFTTLNSDISNLKAGNHVNFTFIQQGNISLLQEIKATQS